MNLSLYFVDIALQRATVPHFRHNLSGRSWPQQSAAAEYLERALQPGIWRRNVTPLAGYDRHQPRDRRHAFFPE